MQKATANVEESAKQEYSEASLEMILCDFRRLLRSRIKASAMRTAITIGTTIIMMAAERLLGRSVYRFCNIHFDWN